MADARTLARAITRRLGIPVIPPSHESSDGLPENERLRERVTQLEGAEYAFATKGH